MMSVRSWGVVARGMAWWGVVLALAPLLVTASAGAVVDPAAAKARDAAVEVKLVAELRAVAPDAVDDYLKGNAARDKNDDRGALEAYRRVLEAAPRFTHALRRACGAELRLGQRAKALELCEEAVRIDASSYNLAGLAMALIGWGAPGPVSPTTAEGARALELAGKAIEADPQNDTAYFAQCLAAAEKKRRDLLASCSAKLEAIGVGPMAGLAQYFRALTLLRIAEGGVSGNIWSEAQAAAGRVVVLLPEQPLGHVALAQIAMARNDEAGLAEQVAALLRKAPNDLRSHYFAAILAVSQGEYGKARAAARRAGTFGMPAAAVDELLQQIDKAEPWYKKYTPPVVWTLAIWLGGMLLLVLLGLVLSHSAMRAAAELPREKSGRAHGMAGTLRSIYRAVLWLCCVYYYLSLPLVVLLVLLVPAGIILAILAAGFVSVKLFAFLGIAALVTLWSIGKSLLSRIKDEDPGMRLDLDEHPRLRRVLREVAEKIGTRPVDTVFLTPGTDIAVFERGGVRGQLRGSSLRCLVLGAGVLDGMPLAQLRAILAHEYGHFSNRDTAGGGLALSVRNSLMQMARGMAEGGVASWFNPGWLFLNGFLRVFLRVSQGASRLQEVLADRWAVFAYGSDPFIAGLHHSIERSVRFDAHCQSALTEVIEGKRPLANLYRYRPAEAPDAGALELAIEEAMTTEPSVYDSHPAPRDRIAWVRELAIDIEPADDDEHEAWSLLEDREQLEQAMTEQVRDNVLAGTGVYIPVGERDRPEDEDEDEDEHEQGENGREDIKR